MHQIHLKNLPNKEEFSDFLQDLNDLSLHERIIQNALKLIKKIEEIEVVLLEGSLALDRGDVFSDIDFYIILNDGQQIEFVREKILKNLEKIGKVLHIYMSNANKKDLIIYFSPFIKFELILRGLEFMTQKDKFTKNAKILFDRNGLGKKAFEKGKSKEFRIEKHIFEIQNFAISVPSLCFIAAGYLKRGEIITSMDFVAWIRRNLMRISGFLLGMKDEGTRRAEERFPKEINEFYHQIKIDTLNELWESLETILSYYANFLAPEFKKHNIPSAKEEVPLISAMIKKLRTH